MSKNHIFGLICSMLYLVVVGFAEFPPKTETPLTFTTAIPLELIVEPTQTVTDHDTEENREIDRVAKAIINKYRRVDHETAIHVATLVYQQADVHELKPELILALIATESSFNPNSLSHEGAKGYTQVIPRWHRDKILGRNIWEASVNIEVGVKVLKECFQRNRSEYSALACYNGAKSYETAIVFVRNINKHRQYFSNVIQDPNWG